MKLTRPRKGGDGRHRRDPFRRLIAIAIGLGIATSVTAAPAWAHNEVIETSPGDGGALTTLPAELSVTFSEQLDPSQTEIAVTRGGVVVDGLAAPVVAENRIEQELGAGSVPGEYVLAYRVVSTDGHPVSGTLGFTVDVPVQASVPATPQPSSASPLPSSATPLASPSIEAVADGEDEDSGHQRALITAGVGLAVVLALAGAGTVLVDRRYRSRR